jgi:serine/threonine-protein kinase
MVEPDPKDEAAPVPQALEQGAHSTWAPEQTTDEVPRAEADGAVTGPYSPQTPGDPTIPSPETDAKSRNLPHVSGYEMWDVLGQGGMGVVYRARDIALGRTVALKMLRAGALANPQEIQRFYREAQAAAQLNHPHLVPVYEVRRHGNLHYFTMAYVGGGTLADHMDRFRDPKAAVALMEKVARGVDYAHRHQILHRDLKPSNILLNEADEPLVSDFGLAKLLDSELELTQPGDMVGTPLYMAPEQATGRSDQACPASDIWALGVMLYELLTGQRPFKGKSREELMRDIQSTYPPRPRSVRSQLPTDLETICLKCLEKNPAHRYASAEALADDLSRWRAGEPILAKPAPWSRRLWRKVRRHPVVCTAAVMLVAVMAAGLTWRYHTDPDRELRAIQNDLVGGRPAVVIGETGRPRWSHWETGEAGAGINARDGCFYIQTAEYSSLLEIMPDPTVPSYRFRAEVRHDENLTGLGEVGIYFGHEKLLGQKGPADSHLVLRFADTPNNSQVIKDAKGQVFGRVRLEYRYYRKEDEDPGSNQQSLITKPGQAAVLDFVVTAKSFRESPWRPLAVEVEPDEVRVFWNYQLFAVMPRADIEKCADAALDSDETKDLKFRFNPRAALGLYVNLSTASFRNVVLEPIPLGN